MSTNDTASEAYPDSKILLLRKPVSFGGKEIDALELREPTAGEMKQADALTGQAWAVKIVALVSGVPEKAIEGVSQRDVMEAVQYITGFWKTAPSSGG